MPNCRCSEEQLIELLRDVVWVMGRSNTHQHLFIKFQSALVPYMHTILKAFPNTPWVFLFRYRTTPAPLPLPHFSL